MSAEDPNMSKQGTLESCTIDCSETWNN